MAIFAVQIPAGGGHYMASFIPLWIRVCFTRNVRVLYTCILYILL